jgi:hypothetical protein
MRADRPVIIMIAIITITTIYYKLSYRYQCYSKESVFFFSLPAAALAFRESRYTPNLC